MRFRLSDLIYLLPTLLRCDGMYLGTVSSSIPVVDSNLLMMVCDANGIARAAGYLLASELSSNDVASF